MTLRHLYVLALLLPATAAAEVYRWTDAQGHVQYTETPPPGRSATRLPPPAPPSAAPNQDAINESLDQSIKDGPKKREEATAAAAAEAKQRDDCKHVRDELAQLEVAGRPRRMVTQDGSGAVTRWTPEEYQKRLAETRQYLQDKCSG